MAINEEQRLLDACFIHLPVYGHHPSIQSYATPVQKKINWKGEGRGLALYPGSRTKYEARMGCKMGVAYYRNKRPPTSSVALKSWADTNGDWCICSTSIVSFPSHKHQGHMSMGMGPQWSRNETKLETESLGMRPGTGAIVSRVCPLSSSCGSSGGLGGSLLKHLLEVSEIILVTIPVSTIMLIFSTGMY